MIVIMLETRVASSYMNKILSHSSLTKFSCSEARGYAGGIWVIWNSSRVQVEVVTIDDQIINRFV